jgi:hypothetical protein
MDDKQLAVAVYQDRWGPGGTRAAVTMFLDDAYAVMMGESGGNPAAKNANSSASGLFQIMVSVHGDKIARSVKKYSTNGRVATIFDPDVNIDVARQVWEAAGHSWKPWEAYNKKTDGYRKNKGHGQAMYDYLHTRGEAGLDDDYAAWLAAWGGIKGNDTSPDLGNLLDPANWKDAIVGIAGQYFGFMKSAGITVGAFLLGVIVLIIGAWLLISNTKTGNQIKSAATAVATKGVVK